MRKQNYYLLDDQYNVNSDIYMLDGDYFDLLNDYFFLLVACHVCTSFHFLSSSYNVYVNL